MWRMQSVLAAHSVGGGGFASSVARRFRNLFWLMSCLLMWGSLWLSCAEEAGKRPTTRSRHRAVMGGGRASGIRSHPTSFMTAHVGCELASVKPGPATSALAFAHT